MSKRGLEKPLTGMVIAITGMEAKFPIAIYCIFTFVHISGTLSVQRAVFESFIIANGGSVAKTVTNSCTHLVSSETGTKKCQDAAAKGIMIVNEQWIRNKVSEGGSSDSESEGPAIKKAPIVTTSASASGLKGLVFAISGALTVSRAEFEGYIMAQGGAVAKSVTKSVTHLVSAETGTKKCEDAIAKGVVIVNEDWVRNRVANGTNDSKDNVIIPPQSFVPLLTYVEDLLTTEENEGRCEREEGGKNVDKIVFNRYEDEQMEKLYKIISYKKNTEGEEEGEGEGVYTLKSLTDDDDDIILELNDDDLYDNWWTLPPPHTRNRWERFQSKPIAEGVFMTVAKKTLQDNINTQIDKFAASEPIDYHPNSNQVVRDLIHPSLYPLIIDPNSICTDDINYWNRSYEQSRFQWLPSEVMIDNTGKAKFVSPINNFDNEKYPELTNSLENVLTALIPGFEKVWEYCQYMSFTENDGTWDGLEYDPESINPVSFKNTNLQVIVKIADYTFSPGTSFQGVWHYEGMAHENIVMTGLFYPHSDERLNSNGGLEFKRQFTDVEAVKLLARLPQQRPFWVDNDIELGFVPLGYTTTETGKLMVFPNCHAHRVQELINHTSETLKRRLIVFFVVDPNDRITSSKDMPPMPRKISLETALADRLELMQERKQAKQALNPREVELCEH